jgi:hypothetical protein
MIDRLIDICAATSVILGTAMLVGIATMIAMAVASGGIVCLP